MLSAQPLFLPWGTTCFPCSYHVGCQEPTLPPAPCAVLARTLLLLSRRAQTPVRAVWLARILQVVPPCVSRALLGPTLSPAVPVFFVLLVTIHSRTHLLALPVLLVPFPLLKAKALALNVTRAPTPLPWGLLQATPAQPVPRAAMLQWLVAALPMVRLLFLGCHQVL